jgi:hypothetical protein
MKKGLLFILTLMSLNVFAQMSNLIISEYAEGSGGNKKYIELFNGTGAPVNLGNYQLVKATNGGGYTTTISLTGTLANNTTYSIANNATDVPGANLYNVQINHNGDDAYALKWNGGTGSVYSIIDVFGDPTNDPGTGWAVAGVANATVDKILTRKPNVCGPNTNWATIQGVDSLSSEYFISVALYNQVSQNSGMGSHVHNCVASCVTYNTITATACNSYSLNNQTYTATGAYVQTLANANAAGCDSIINLNLTINNANSSTLNITNCGPYTLNNQTYNASGTYTQLTQNIAGCDSTINLNLTIQTPISYYQDLDNDGYGNTAVTQSSCTPITGFVTNNTDCNDNNNAIHPGAMDIPANGIDEDCNGTDALPCVSYNTLTATACNTYSLNNQTYTASGTYVQTLANANAAGCDSIINLQLTINNSTSSVLNFSECSPFILNNQTYTASGVYTQNLQNAVGCDSTITINLTIINPITVYQDLDNDGYGDAAVSQTSCAAITGFVTNSSDCNDNNNAIYPGAIDVPGNGIDEDCNGFDAPLQLGIYQFTGTVDCNTQDVAATNTSSNWIFSDFISQGTNCASGGGYFNRSGWNQSALFNPAQYNEFTISGANCSNLNLTKLALNHRTSTTGGTPTIFVRSSLDNFANDIDTLASGPNGSVVFADTINLSAAFTNVAAVTFRFYVINQATSTSTLRMDNVSVWGNAITITPALFYADADGDGFGDLANDSLSCSAPIGYVSNNTDCNDTDAMVNPNSVWYQDSDNDQVGNTSVTQTACLQPAGYVLANGDCDDNNASIVAPTMYYSDNDQDGFGDDATGTLFCQAPVNMIAIGGDCDDNNNAVNPGASEVCDGLDNNCNGQFDEGLTFVNYYFDGDSDGFGIGNATSSCSPIAGYATQNGDCDDTNSSAYPGAADTQGNGIDENCDGVDGVLGLASMEMVASIVPNPTNGLVELRFNQEVTGQIRLTDLNGKVLQIALVNGLSHTLDLTNLKQGSYLVQINQNIQRIVKL